jgi:ABC-type sugar transport system ATPase subunit
LAALDKALRSHMQLEIRQLQQKLGITVLYVTHDQEEAMTLGGRVAVMRDGAVEQVEPPLDVYRRPANTFVARFIGAPAMNLVPATLIGVDAPAGAVVGIRPQEVTLAAGGPMRATVDLVEPRGPDHLLHLRLDSSDAIPFVAVIAGIPPPPVGAQVFVAVDRERLHVFDGRNGRRLP